MSRRRLEAEAIRDAILTLAGRLDGRFGGPADSDPQSPRRMLYVQATRTSRSGLGPLFDAANPAMHVERRTVSTVAPQALYLMNEPLVAGAARFIVERPEIAEADTALRIRLLYELILGRPPADDEAELGASFIERAAPQPLSSDPSSPEAADPWTVYTQALLLSNEFLFVD
jgi:hypothetical protein